MFNLPLPGEPQSRNLRNLRPFSLFKNAQFCTCDFLERTSLLNGLPGFKYMSSISM